MRLLFTLIISLGLLNCSRTTDNTSNIQQADSLGTTRAETVETSEFDYESQFKLESYLTDDIGNKTYETIDFDCAILIYPTDNQRDEMIRVEGEDDFHIGADDSNWYQAQAIDAIDSVGIKIITVTGQYLRLKGQYKFWDLDIRKKNLPAWNLIFFTQTKEPEVISTIDLTVEKVQDYFKSGK